MNRPDFAFHTILITRPETASYLRAGCFILPDRTPVTARKPELPMGYKVRESLYTPDRIMPEPLQEEG